MKHIKLSISLALVAVAAFSAPWLTVSGAAASEPEAVLVVSGPLRFEERLIMKDYAYPFGIAAADLDGDGDLDLSSADALPHNDLYWFENDGKGHFSRHFIQKDDPERLERHGIGDVDGDGDPDVVIVKNLEGDLLWFENNGSPRDGKLWRRHVITRGGLPGAYDVALADLDRDGDLDVAASSWRLGNQFAWFENDGTPADGPWKKHLIDANVPETYSICAADFDGDGDLDLFGTGAGGKISLWYENTRTPASGPWPRHVIDDRSPRPVHGHPVDMDGDGDLDVVLALGMPANANDPEVKVKLGFPTAADAVHTNQVAWYENSGQPASGPWKKRVIGSLLDAFEAVASDLDGDGDVDVAATSWRTPGRVVWFENHGEAKGRWTIHAIKDDWRSANQVIIADLDGDGRPDIAAVAERGSCEFRWWRNLGANGGRSTSAVETPVFIGEETQLFLDDHVVAESKGLAKTVHPPQRHGPAVIEAEMPWEGPYLTYPCPVVVGEKIYLYYKSYPTVWVGKGKKPADFKTMLRVVCVAASEDGVNFRRPELPYFTGEDFKHTNVVWAFYKGPALNATAGVGIVNDAAEADPQKRFKMVWSAGNTNTFAPATKIEGPSVAFSPDGLNWSAYDANPICNKFNSDTQQCVVYDPVRKKWVWLLRMWEKPPSDGRIAWRQYGGRIRAVGRMESDDFVNWSEPEFVVRRDKDDPEFTDFYGLQAVWRHGMMIGFLWSAEWPTKYSDDVWPGSHGKMHAQLVVSRDSGKSWTRVDRRRMIFSPGPEGSWDSAQVYPGPMLTRGDRHYVYYAGANVAHGGGRRRGNPFKSDSRIGLAAWKLDRLVSLDAPPQGGRLTTKPLCFSGNRLVINAATQAGGGIVVELLDAAGEPHEGFARSDPFQGDELRHVVAFDGNADVSKLQGKTIKIRFHLKDAELYSYAFCKEGNATSASSKGAATGQDRCKNSSNEIPRASVRKHNGGRFVISNSHVERIIETSAYLRTTSIVNKTADPPLHKTVDSKGFTLAMDDEKLLLTSSDFKVGEPEIMQESNTARLRVPLRCEKHGVEVIVTYSLGDGDFYLRKQLEINTGEHLLNWVDVESFRIAGVELRRFDRRPMPFRKEPWDINVGRPLFADRDMFLGVEHPASVNSFDESKHISLRQYPGRRGEVKTAPAVIGFCPDRPRERLSDYFEKYIDRNRAHSPRRSLQWIAYFRVSMSDEQCREKIAVAERVFRRRGAPLDVVLMDSGWTDRQSIMRISPERPDRLALIKKLAEEHLDAELGLHVVTSGVKRMVDKDYLAAQGYDMIYHKDKQHGAYCFADPWVFQEFRDNLLDYVRLYNVASYKYDWGYFDCKAKNHRGHLTGREYALEAGADNFIRVNQKLREANPDIFLYNTGWFSPWWLWSYDAVFVAGGDYNFRLHGPSSYHTSSLLCSWRDATIRGNIVRWSPFFPINSLMTVDPISYWWHVWDMHSESPLRPFTDYFVTACLRGTQLTEIYNNISAWSDAHADAAADVLKWMKAHDDVILASTRYVGGDPLAGEPYGYAHFTRSNRGIIVVRNPSIVPHTSHITFDEQSGMWPSDKQHVVRVVYPYTEALAETISYGSKLDMQLTGEEVRVLEILPLDGLDEPMPVGCRYRVVAREPQSTTFELCGDMAELEFFSPVKPAKADAVGDEKHRYAINLADMQPNASNATANRPQDASEMSAGREGSEYVVSVDVPENSQAQVSLLFSEPRMEGAMSLDGKAVDPDAPHISLRDAAGRAESKYGLRASAPNWSLFGLEISPGKHQLRFLPSKPVKKDAQAIVELRSQMSPRQTIKIKHASIYDRAKLSLPQNWIWQQRRVATKVISPPFNK